MRRFPLYVHPQMARELSGLHGIRPLGIGAPTRLSAQREPDIEDLLVSGGEEH